MAAAGIGAHELTGQQVDLVRDAVAIAGLDLGGSANDTGAGIDHPGHDGDGFAPLDDGAADDGLDAMETARLGGQGRFVGQVAGLEFLLLEDMLEQDPLDEGKTAGGGQGPNHQFGNAGARIGYAQITADIELEDRHPGLGGLGCRGRLDLVPFFIAGFQGGYCPRWRLCLPGCLRLLAPFRQIHGLHLGPQRGWQQQQSRH